MNLVSAGHPKKVVYAISKSATLNCMVSVWKFFRVPRSQEERSDQWVSLLHQGLCHGKEPDWCAEKI
jgi:hypothetical protein